MEIEEITKKMSTDFNSWPQWPYLPLRKKEEGETKCGFLCEGEGSTVILGNVFHLPETVEGFRKLERIKYESVDEMIEDGWLVD